MYLFFYTTLILSAIAVLAFLLTGIGCLVAGDSFLSLYHDMTSEDDNYED